MAAAKELGVLAGPGPSEITGLFPQKIELTGFFSQNVGELTGFPPSNLSDFPHSDIQGIFEGLGLGFRAVILGPELGFRVWGLFNVEGLGFRVWGLTLEFAVTSLFFTVVDSIFK